MAYKYELLKYLGCVMKPWLMYDFFDFHLRHHPNLLQFFLIAIRLFVLQLYFVNYSFNCEKKPNL